MMKKPRSREGTTVRVAADGDVVQQGPEQFAVLVVVGLRDEGPAQHNAQTPEGQHQTHPVALVVPHRKAPACILRT